MDFDVIDERVSAVDVVGEVGEGFAGACGANPECEAGDFDGFLGEVHAVEVAFEDEVGDLFAHGGSALDALGDEVAERDRS